MKRLLILCFTVCLSLWGSAQIGYNFSATAGAYTANAGTVIVAASVDDGTSASTAIGFTFKYGCVNYTTFQACSNGVMFLGTAAAGTNLFNDLTNSTDRPAIAPLWDDLKTDATGNVNYKVTGAVGSRILTVEWLNMLWNFASASPAITFQVKLYEATGNIDFVYSRIGGAAANVNSASASIGISGPTVGDFYSLDGTSAAPIASKAVETNTITSPKPATGQVYTWAPQVCSGPPTAGLAIATPSLQCAAYTTTLTLSGSTSACGLTYQWQSANALAGPWTNIAGATSNTATAAVPATKYFRCVVSCGASSVASTPATASLTAAGSCGICGINSITLPFSGTGLTTCGQGDDVTAANATNICGSSSYYGGEDAVFSFTPATSGQITITYSTSGSSAGIMLYQGCPVSGGTCVGNNQGISSFSGNITMCVNVTAGQAYYLVIDSWPSPTCNGYNLSISAPSGAVPACSLSNYAASVITYSFDAFVGTTVANTDDILFNNIAMFGFPFCYTGASYSGGYIASNGSFVFDAVPCYPNVYFNQVAAPGIGTGWSITGPAPSQVSGTNSLPQNAVNAPWQDINPALGGVTRYGTLGVAPNRRFVVSWESIPMFSCGTSSPTTYYTGQVKLYETSNIIEIHVANKQLCPTWNNGQAIMGLTSYDGLTYVPPVNATAHNATAASPYNQWTMTNKAYRFSAACATSGPCLVLPVSFKSFYGERSDRVNHLYWETAEEENLRYFSVERSADAENFTEIAKVSPHNSASKYQYDDITTQPGTLNYYRITSTETSGATKTTNVITLGAGNGEVAVSGIYPNPVKSELTMSIESKLLSTVSISVYDSFGKCIKTMSRDIGTGVSQFTIDCSDIPAGIYLLETTNSNKEIVSKQKLVKVN
ncbi:MAG: T9SS type A sorting domain-containing protein [Bacteroidia bacterium]